MTISDRLTALMRRRGIRSQSQLARISGVPQSSIHRILSRGENYSVGTGTLRKLAAALDTSVAWLSEGTEVLSPRGGRRLSLGVAEAAREADENQDGDVLEAIHIFQRLSPDERRKVLAVLRLLPSVAGQPQPAEKAAHDD
ncbi:helix-turn-helix transcriptional regulator [Orrella sp. JC864]|uniref:helix-turn-helix domain-containing protein n=1 Tax=Orrella sp. JC864 TaxID=3120298 RepID=UPI0012BD7CDE